MRVAVASESFLPEVNGVTNTVLRVLEHLQRHGHQALVLASGRGGPTDYAGAPVVRALSVPVPRYRSRSLSSGLPVEILGFVADRRELAALLATADLVLAPGPVETFGLTALESLACGTPVVAARSGALPELLAAAEEGAGLAVHPCGPAMAAAAATVLAWDPARRRAAARRRATRFPWSATVAGMLSVHRLEGPVEGAG